MLFASNKTKL